jgi:O-antigen ligase
LYAAIALKDCAIWLLADGSFTAFAKSGSRIVSLFGAAAILSAYDREKAERVFGTALGVFAAGIALITLLMRFKTIPHILNANSFGMDFCWFPLCIVSMIRRKAGAKAEAAALAVGIGGAAIIAAEAFLNNGSRTAPIAYLAGLLFIYLARPLGGRKLTVAVVVMAIAGIFALSITFSPKLNSILAHRQELWNAYASKGAEKPLTGWGYTGPDENKRLLDDKLTGKPVYEMFSQTGLGPHNSFLSMFFENGIIAAAFFAVLLIARAFKSKRNPDIFDTSFIVFLVFMSTDAMSAGGITFLGFFLGACVLAGDKA